MDNVVMIYSGGMDSTVLLYELLMEGHFINALTVNYGQKHSREIESAIEICKLHSGLNHKIADLSRIKNFIAGSSQTSDDVEVPEGHYAEESMKQTVVPNRNMIMLSLAVGWAIKLGCPRVYYANHSGDHTIYPDCRPEFVRALDEAVSLCDWNPVRLQSPFRHISKADICERGHRLGVPFSKTWSCYKGREKHCGKCGTCVERKEAFAIAGIQDPTDYE